MDKVITKQLLFLLLCVLSLGALNEVCSQTKVTLETNSFPRNFEGVDPVILSNNLYSLLEKQQATGKSAEFIKNKLNNQAVYGNLTTNDLFAFVPESSKYISGRTGDFNYLSGRTEQEIISGNLYRLINSDEFPEPKVITVKSCGTGKGRGGKYVSSREDLVSEYDSGLSIQNIWKQGLIHLTTTINDDAKSQDYKGVKGTYCNESEFFVPSPQFQFELGFVNPQPFRLLNVSQNVFWFDSYKYQTVNGAGIVAWNTERNYSERSETKVPVFMAKLVSPYFKREVLTKKDVVEGKVHTAIRNIIYIELVAIWLVSQETGEVLSKNAHEPIGVLPTNESSKLVSQSSPLNLISKPQPNYSESIKQNKIRGTVLLRVTFLSNGKIGEIFPVSDLPPDLIEAAIKAARRIQFKPAMKDGVPYTVSRRISYAFP